jgi:hypothetical protein
MRRILRGEVWLPYAALALAAAGLLSLWASWTTEVTQDNGGLSANALDGPLNTPATEKAGLPLMVADPSPTPSPGATPSVSPAAHVPASLPPRPQATAGVPITLEPTKTAIPLPSPTASRTPQVLFPVRWGYYLPADPASRASLEGHIGELSVLAPVWFQMDARGRVVPSSDDDRGRVLRMAQERGVLVLPLVVNGPRYAELHPLLAEPGRRRAAITNLARLVETEGYDGIHIDFEAIDGADRPHLTAFMEELAAAFRPRGWLVTQAIAAKEQERTTGWAGAYDYAALGRANDLVVLMAYGYRTYCAHGLGQTDRRVCRLADPGAEARPGAGLLRVRLEHDQRPAGEGAPL